MRATSKPTIKFGLVTLPCATYKVQDPKGVHFRQIHKKCMAPIRYKKVCAECGEEVQRPYKGYEYEKGNYVLVEQDELEALKVESDKMIEIKYFTALSELNPLSLAGNYQYIGTEKKFASIYGMLRHILESENLGGIGTFRIRGQEKNVVLFVLNGTIVMDEILTEEEVRYIYVEQEIPDEQTLALGKELVNKMTKKFKWNEIVNGYVEDVEDLVDRKRKGEKIEKKEVKKEAKKTGLMDSLRASLQA